MPVQFTLRVNGEARQVEVEPDRTLLSVLRDELGLTGAKYGCGEGQCGACTVLIEGNPVRSCLARVSGIGDGAITTIEGLEQNGKLHPVQEAFLETQGFQCGYCTSGQILTGVSLLRRNPKPAAADIRRAMQSNVCRCGVYTRIIEAVAKAAGTSGEGK